MTAPGWASNQGTLARELRLYGRGLHTGKRVNVRVHPERVGHGIVFRRMRGGQQLALLPASAALRLGQPLCTALQNADGWRVRTVEHLLAALLACQIDHATVEIDAEEVPILDGSAQPWLQAIEACGRLPLDAPKRFLRILKTVAVEDGGMHRTIIEPADHYAMSVTNDLKGFGEMNWQGIIDPVSFASDIAPSRSYGRLRWAVPAILFGYLRGQPILRGARPSCTATIVGSGVIGGMRLPMEFVRHRVLDLIGDLALLGAPLLGKVTALRPSHEMNYRLCAALLARPDAWEWAYPTH
ncbi:UDP-3-O-[3-hydroxymyristoyl] N-acetylglucosamine deacetylase [Ralstonia pickettii]|jgi:UDP-3-O-[3-hydroxymyristoyl] N-acetylglucosamine deacetylase|uniref:UDP-3-O-acyl-N-acetylglucosamine deacetylase n=4 Tax=Pseudomonadota TaxID=1224 RepID=A0AAD2BUX1_9RALS|nr:MULTISPECIES: UDP-3-O-acyl N-acetylglycosamine deacetylase [Ralstonia]EFP64303.1 UDP-3-O-[3-hydroxymyristoyl] N-acetylglucosamine deacetylase [Ralstonia pickettii]EGY64255.1 UDP-3-O-[3-hydroxymyristoyl] N-acetylglucosamine deacetylase [Ralstonia sp. 5_2_56FAA]KFL24402.1 UDP-3-O-acyl N-acetylglycosamine deacetylase family protein [Ralstonia pickettii]MBT2180944.1 UDP-3-O-acyl N-acetylglycosamine deacetylase [Ralstonia pickettii]MBU6523669.1 UDP-3-O-acyl N-acetylglycosamine deacetylase [Ralst